MILVSNRIFLAIDEESQNLYFARSNIQDGDNSSRWLPFPALKSLFGSSSAMPQLAAVAE